MLHHYITKYVDEGDGHLWCVAWLQANVLGKCICFGERREDLGPAPEWHLEETSSEKEEDMKCERDMKCEKEGGPRKRTLKESILSTTGYLRDRVESGVASDSELESLVRLYEIGIGCGLG